MQAACPNGQAASACRKSLFAMRGAGIHRRPSRFPCALPPKTEGATGRKNLFFPLPLLSELVKVLIIFDFNGAGKQAKRRRWRIKRVCFEEGSQSADIKYPLIGLSRRCIPSWVSRAHLSFPLRKSLLAAHRPFSPLGLSMRQEPPCGGCAPKRACGRSPTRTFHPQGVCSIRKAAQAALPYRRRGFTTLLTGCLRLNRTGGKVHIVFSGGLC